MKLEKYAAQNPQEAPELPEAPAITLKERQEEINRARDLMKDIARKMDQGNAPENILLTAIECIVFLTRDQEWGAARIQQLDKTFSDLSQQSLVIDNAAIAAERLQRQQEEYTEKLRRSLQRQLGQCQSIERKLDAALKEVLSHQIPEGEQ